MATDARDVSVQMPFEHRHSTSLPWFLPLVKIIKKTNIISLSQGHVVKINRFKLHVTGGMKKPLLAEINTCCDRGWCGVELKL